MNNEMLECEKCHQHKHDVTALEFFGEGWTVGNICNECRRKFNLEMLKGNFIEMYEYKMKIYKLAIAWLKNE